MKLLVGPRNMEGGHIHLLGILLALAVVAVVFYSFSHGRKEEEQAKQLIELQKVEQMMVGLKSQLELLEVRVQLLEKRHD